MKSTLFTILILLDYSLILTNLLGVTNVSWWVLTLPITAPITGTLLLCLTAVFCAIIATLITTRIK